MRFPFRCSRIALARGGAGFVALLSLTDLYRAAMGWPAEWWLDLRALGNPLSMGFRAVLCALLAGYALAPAMGQRRRLATRAALTVGALLAVCDTAVVLALLAGGRIASAVPVPVSAIVVVLLLALRRAIGRDGALGSSAGRGPWAAGWGAAVAAGVACACFALAQMVLYGGTSYRRSADAVVVFGARVYADGEPSLALSDRVHTACALVREGRAEQVILSGGPGDGDTHETEAMRRLALDCGIAPDRIVVDADGLSTWHTARNTARVLASRGGGRVLAVSHDYHLPRVKLALSRAGVEAFTVPAEETRTLTKLPYFMAREIAAFWVYYLV